MQFASEKYMTEITLIPATIWTLDDLPDANSVPANELYCNHNWEADAFIEKDEARNTVIAHLFRYGDFKPEWYARACGPMTADERETREKKIKEWVQSFYSSVIGRKSWLWEFVAGTVCRDNLLVHIGNCYLQARWYEFPDDVPETRQQIHARREKVRKFDDLAQFHIDAYDVAVSLAVRDALIDLGNHAKSSPAKIYEKQRILDHFQSLENDHLSQPYGRHRFTSREEIETHILLSYSARPTMDLDLFWDMFEQDVFVRWFWDFRGVIDLRDVWEDENETIWGIHFQRFRFICHDIYRYGIARDLAVERMTAKASENSIPRSLVFKDLTPEITVRYSDFEARECRYSSSKHYSFGIEVVPARATPTF